ncbi:MAG: DUF3883 domain-containing protein [Cyanobacteria bacterium P01_D01_bin.50]
MEKAHRQQTATKLFDGIRKLYSSESSPRRWIWELLQNAKDVAKNKVKVEIIFNNEFLEFRHNGKPFLMKNITYLIEQVSTKDRNSKKYQDTNEAQTLRTTGKFGTGFMTTHLLSKKVELNSIFEDPSRKVYKRFQLKLDRSATSVEEMIEAVKNASNIRRHLDDENICPTLSNYQPHGICDTSFRYQLDEDGLQFAQQGIEDLSNAIVYTLVFIPEIESVLVKDENTSQETLYEIEYIEKKEHITIYHIEKRTGKQVEEILIASCSKTICLADEKGDVSIAIQLEKKGDKYSVIKLNSSIPLLYCDFPLIGSETKFKCPVVINSPLLEPTEPRDSVLLDDRNETGGKKNREIFVETISLYSILLDYAALYWLNAHLLAKSGLPKNIELEWYESQIQSQIRAKVLTTPIVFTKDNQKIELNNALIPYSSKNILPFWQLAIALHLDKLPQKQDVKDWYDIITTDSGWPKELRYDLSRLLADIHEQENLENLCMRLALSEADTLVWLNQVIAFVFKAKQTELLNSKYAILPNQYGEFQLKTELVKDEGIPQGLKDVLLLLGEDWKKELLYLEVNCQLERSYNIRNISERISGIITEQQHPNLREATYLLISYIPNTINTKKNLPKDILNKRNQIWEFAKALDRNVPEKQQLSNWISSLWDTCDEWILKTLIQDIANCKQVSVLQVKIEQTTELETVEWLSRFINFLKEHKKASLYSEQAIFPNQQGILNKKADLLFDNDIPEELKNTLEKFGSDCRNKLLHRKILGFEDNLKHLSVSDISKEINEIIRDKDSNQDDDFKMAIYDLISYFKVGSKEEKRLNIWQFSRDIHGQIIPEKIFLNNLNKFSWKECNKWIITLIVEQISQTQNLNNLINLLSLNQENTISWLNNFIYFINKFDDRLLDSYSLMPTQNGDFQLRKNLKKDGGIPEELKEISRYLKLQEWDDLLLLNDSNFTDVQEIIEESDTANIADIAVEIDNAIRDYDGDKQDNSFREVVKQLLHWSNSISETEFKKLFTYFYDHRAEIVLQALGDDETRNNIFDVLQVESPKLNALANLARNSDITAEDLNQISENLDKYKVLENLKGKSDVENEVIKLLKEFGIDLTELINQVSDDTNSIEVPDKESKESSTESRIIKQGDDGSSYGENAEKYGQIGEYWAKSLYDKYLEYTILAVDDSGFDFRCNKGSEELKVEVKARTFSSPIIRFTVNEWKKMVAYKDNYELLIFSHEKGVPKEFIRVKKAWLTLVDILACLKNQPLSNASYSSSNIESLIGLQSKSRERGNDIIIHWHRLFKDNQHQDITKYQYNDSSGFYKL